MSGGIGRTTGGGANPLEGTDDHDHAHDDGHDHGAAPVPASAASRWPSALDLFARLQAAKGSGPAIFSIFDGAGALEKAVEGLGRDGSISPDDLVDLVIEAKDCGKLTASERRVLEELHDGSRGALHPMAKDALGIFLGRVSVEQAQASAAADAREAAAALEREKAAETAATYATGPLRGFGSAELKSAFPIDMSKGKARLTSSFGAMDVPRAQGAHKGIDLAAPVGTPVRFLEDGKITWVSRENTSLPKGKRGYGNSIYVEFPDGHAEIFAHLNKEAIDKLVGASAKTGSLAKPVQVKKGQAIPGGIGNTGNTTGPHLHWEVRTGPRREAVNPLWWLKNGKGNVQP
jgi:murein DD-endopeptidase MepM/ murein hydrolase activator NlpD